jgi:ubiquinone/menaquinone biosynthesis C-methylase UbiE
VPSRETSRRYVAIGVLMPSADEVLAGQRMTWARCSAGWARWEQVIGDQLRPVGAAIIDSLGIADDQQHLDIACGTGEPGLSIALLAPQGRILLTDLAPEMLAVAERRVSDLGVSNVETAVCSADDLPFADASFDSVSVRFGYMFFPDLAKATAEFARVLKPGGRLCSSVWVMPESNAWTSIVLAAIDAEVGLAAPEPGAPHMFRCATSGTVSELYQTAALREVREWDVAVELVASSAEQYWEIVSEHVSAAVLALARVDPDARERIRRTVVATAAGYEDEGRIRLPGVARCISGTR